MAADSLTWTTLSDDQASGFARGGASLVFDSRRNRIVALCGVWSSVCLHSTVVTNYFTDVHVLDPATGAPWDSIAVGPGVRPQRTYAAAVYDSLADRILLFGGIQSYSSTFFPPPPTVLYDDLWSFALATSTWSVVPTVGTAPSKRWGATLTLDPVRQRVLLYGGRDSAGANLGDVWEMSLFAPGTWSPIAAAGTPPEGRISHLAAYDPGGDRLLVTGGVNYSGTWALSLGATPTWTQVTPPGSGPVGPTIGGLDASRGRLLAVNGRSSLDVWVLDLASGQWNLAAPGGESPLDLRNTFPVFGSAQAVMDPAHDLLAFSWNTSATGICSNSGFGYTHALRFGALPTLTFTATIDNVAYDRGQAYVHWNFVFDRPAWTPIQFESDLTGSFGTITRSSVGTSGPAVVSIPATVNTLYRFRLRWFDGSSFLTTPPMAVMTPPPPVYVIVTQESLFVSGGYLFPRFLLTSDSLRMLTPTTLYHRIENGPWSVLRTDYPEVSGRFWEREDNVPPNTLYEYRLGWGDSTHFSPIFAITTPPAPVFDSSHVESRRISIYWHSIPGANLDARIKKSAPGGEPWVGTVGVHTDAEGLIVFTDLAVAPSTFYNYELTWVEGGIERISTQIGLATPADPVSPFLGLSSPYPNPTAGAFSLTLDILPGPDATVELVDIMGRSRWSKTVASGHQPLVIDARGLESGIYGLSVRQGGATRSRRIAIIR